LKDDIRKVQQFHEAFGLTVTDAPAGAIPAELRALRISLLEEELEEYKFGNRSRGTTKDRGWLFVPVRLHRIG
jgi:hypothetical protein